MSEAALGSRRVADHPILGRAPDREVVTVTVDGREIAGYAGEPIAATLLAHGIRIFRTMPESDEPRGMFTGIGRSSDELMTVDGELNVPVTTTPLRASMVIETQRGLGQWREDT